MTVTIGIDLGTTNSCVATAKGVQAKILPSLQGYRTIPSIVARNAAGKILVGHLAKRQAVTNPANTIYAAKRLMGRRFTSTEVQKAVESYPFSIVKGDNEEARVKIDNKVFTPQEIAALILADIKAYASEAIGEEVKRAIITVPAYFNDNQRQATKDAGTIAGLDVLRVINEPTAACIAYGMGRKRDEIVVVFDFGGGTFDVSVIHIRNSVFEVLATSGDSYLGGEDVDIALLQYLLEYGKKTYGIDFAQNPLAMQRLKLAAEEGKKNLSFQTLEQIVLPFIAQDDKGSPVNFEIDLSRTVVEELARPFIEKALAICERTLQACEMKKANIDNVLLVGGQTRMPLVQATVAEYFGKIPRKGINPDEVVAMGAAIEATILDDDKSDILLLDVTPLDLGIASQGGLFSVLIEANTRVPIKRSHIFTTVMDGQETVLLQVYQGGSEHILENELLGEFSLTGIRKAPRGEPQIEVTFEISSEGIVSVFAKDLDTGLVQGIEVSHSNHLPTADIEALRKENEQYAVELAVD